MKKSSLLIAFTILIGVTFFACNKDDNLNDGATVVASFAGQVIDEDGAAIKGATVLAGGELVLTDANGVFRIKPTRLNTKNAIISISKVGYFEFSRAYVVPNGAIQTVSIQLLKKKLVATIHSGTGGVINVPGGATLNFPANAISYKSGDPYMGSVRVYARYLDPTDPDLALNMPGDLRAINAGDQDGVLATFGMIGVEIEDPAQQGIEIATGSEVEIRMPIPLEKSSVAPSEIALWHYDKTSARWIEEGSAQKIGNEYVGKVKHFSFWNCDAFFEVVYLEGNVFLGNAQTPLTSGGHVVLKVLSNGFQGYGYLDQNGRFAGAVPKGEVMDMEISAPSNCGGQLLYAATIGPFNDDVVLPDIITSIQNVEVITVSGRLIDCSGAGISNGYLRLNIDGQNAYFFADANGDFDLSSIKCTVDDGTLLGFDVDNLLEGNLQTFSTVPNAVSLGDIPICTPLGEYIQYSYDGQVYTNVTVNASVWQDSFPAIGFETIISAYDTLQGSIFLRFNSDNLPGTFAINAVESSIFNIDLPISNLNTTVTTAPANVGDILVGTFGNDFIDKNGVSHTLTGSYRVIRDW